MKLPVTRRLVAEFLGVAFLMVAIISSHEMALLNGGPTIGLDHLLLNALATGLMLGVLIQVFAPISGGHLNPAVSLSFVFRGQLAVYTCFFYILAQGAGAFGGLAVAHYMFGDELLGFSTLTRSGNANMVSEAVATFGLVFVIQACARTNPAAVPAAAGLFLAVAILSLPSGAFANPAVTLARSFTEGSLGLDWNSALNFISIQAGAALLASGASAWILSPRTGFVSVSRRR